VAPVPEYSWSFCATASGIAGDDPAETFEDGTGADCLLQAVRLQEAINRRTVIFFMALEL
jgi:hypothetical protein